MGMPEQKYPRDKHATISVIAHRAQDFQSINEYLKDCEQRFKVEYFKKMSTTEQAWNEVMKSTNAAYHFRGKNIVLECLQFGGNREFWDGFNSVQDIRAYFKVCYQYAIDKVGFLRTHENIICAVIITEPNRRNLFVYYLPITEVWQEKIMSDYKSEAGNRLQLRDEYDMPMYRHREEIDEPLLSHSAF